MTRISRFLALLICFSSPLQAATKKNQYGWREIPNTSLRSACPAKGYNGVDYDFSFYCQNVTAAWNGGAFDSKRNRLYIWGGGHTDYMGNEIYALDLNQNKMLRLTSPATPLADKMSDSNPSELMPHDGSQPNSRHTYDAMVYLPNQDRVWAFSGSLASSGGTDSVTWIFDPNTNRWQRVSPKGNLPVGNYGIVSAYNPNTGKVILHDQHALYSYEYTSKGGVYTRLVEDRDYGIHLSAEFDPIRNVFVMAGGGKMFLYDLSPGKPSIRIKPKMTGDNEIINSQGPGLAYDPNSRQIIAWAGGNKSYGLDLDKHSWRAIAHSGDPGPAICNGTYGRWAYSEQLNAFVTYNWYENNAFILRPASYGVSAAQVKTASLSKQQVTNSQTKPSSSQTLAESSSEIDQQSRHTSTELLLIKPSMDTYLSRYQESPGQFPYLQLSTNHRILVQFPSSQLNKSALVKSARLRMYQKKIKPMPPIYTGVFLAEHDWQEDSNWNYSDASSKIKWMHAPGDWVDRSGIVQGGQPFDLQQVVIKPGGQWLEWEVTELVKRWQTDNQSPKLGIVIKSMSGQEQPIELMSREYSDDSFSPQLIIETGSR